MSVKKEKKIVDEVTSKLHWCKSWLTINLENNERKVSVG